MSTNVMKRVKTRKQTARPVKKAQAKTAPIKFPKKNPYSVFVSLPIDDMSYAIDAYIATLNPGQVREISTMNRVKTSIPWIIVNDFFGSIGKHQNVHDAFDRFVEDKKVKPFIVEMKQELAKRKLSSRLEVYRKAVLALNETLDYPELSAIERQPPEESRQSKLLKYDKRALRKMNKQVLAFLATQEGLHWNALSLSNRELIEGLSNIYLPIVPREERPFEFELLSRCESEYKRAPWMKKFYPGAIGGMVVNPSAHPDYAEFATDFEQSAGWFRATARWYANACKKSRAFVPDAVGYFARADGAVVVENRDMFEAASEFFSHPPVEEEELLPTEIVEREKSPISVPPRIVPEIEWKEAEKEKELAPGLFTLVRHLINKNRFACNQCGKGMTSPSLKSVHEKKKIMFCGTECCEKYCFGE